MASQLNRLQGSVAGLVEEIKRLEGNQESAIAKVTSIVLEIDEMQGTLTNMSTMMGEFQARLEAMESDVSKIVDGDKNEDQASSKTKDNALAVFIHLLFRSVDTNEICSDDGQDRDVRENGLHSL